MMLGDWLVLIRVTLLIIGVDGWVLLATSRGPGESDLADRDGGRRPSFTDSIMALLRWRPASRQPAAFRDAVTGLRIEAHDLTDYVCGLADGSMGRVAIVPGTDEEWTALCVRV